MDFNLGTSLESENEIWDILYVLLLMAIFFSFLIF